MDYLRILVYGHIQPMQEIKNGGGVIACPADAAKEVKEICDFVSTKNGGDGAVREFVEMLKKSVLPKNNK